MRTLTSISTGLLFGLSVMGPVSAWAADPAPLLEYSALSGTGSTIQITRLPVQTSGGGTVFKDLNLGLTASADGSISALSILSQEDSPDLLVANIRAGEYAVATNSASTMIVAGPGLVHDGGVAKWTLTPKSGAPCGAPATFYTGPIKQSPLSARLKAAKITNTEYSYGVIDSGTVCSGYNWVAGALVGVAQLGNQMEIAAFSYGNTDYSTPQVRLLYDFVK